MEKLKEIRENRALSQRDLAEIAGIAHTTICRIEKGRNKPNHITTQKMAGLARVVAQGKKLGRPKGSMDKRKRKRRISFNSFN